MKKQLMAIRYIRPTGWTIIRLSLYRDSCWASEDETRLGVDRETVQAVIARKRTSLGLAPSSRSTTSGQRSRFAQCRSVSMARRSTTVSWNRRQRRSAVRVLGGLRPIASSKPQKRSASPCAGNALRSCRVAGKDPTRLGFEETCNEQL